jgi:hypothetical protein
MEIAGMADGSSGFLNGEIPEIRNQGEAPALWPVAQIFRFSAAVHSFCVLFFPAGKSISVGGNRLSRSA